MATTTTTRSDHHGDSAVSVVLGLVWLKPLGGHSEPTPFGVALPSFWCGSECDSGALFAEPIHVQTGSGIHQVDKPKYKGRIN